MQPGDRVRFSKFYVSHLPRSDDRRSWRGSVVGFVGASRYVRVAFDDHGEALVHFEYIEPAPA